MCLFCGQPGSSAEHVFATWLVGVFGGPGVFNLNREHGRNKKRTNTLALISRAACVPCNNTWMSRLEEAARPLLSPSIGGVPARWSPDEQHVIARWAFKTALMTDRTNTPQFWTTPDEDYRYLYEHKEPPPTASVFLTRYVPSDGEVNYLAWTGSAWAQIGDFDWERFKAYRITFNVGQLLFQVFGQLPTENQLVKYHPVRLLPDQTTRDDVFVQLWPLVPGYREWPPSGGHFDTSGMQAMGRGPHEAA